MSESFRSTPPEQQWSGTSSASDRYQFRDGDGEGDNEIGKALLFGLLGGIVSAAGYLVYRRLPDEQKERIHTQVRSMVQQRISEIRQTFNI